MRGRVLRGIGSGLGWGLGMGIALGISTVIGGGMRPVAKGAVKGALWARDQLTVVTAEVRERAEDIYHEALSERAADQALRNGDTATLVHPIARSQAAAVPDGAR